MWRPTVTALAVVSIAVHGSSARWGLKSEFAVWIRGVVFMSPTTHTARTVVPNAQSLVPLRPPRTRWKLAGAHGARPAKRGRGEGARGTPGSKLRVRPSARGFCPALVLSRLWVRLVGLSVYAKRKFLGRASCWPFSKIMV